MVGSTGLDTGFIGVVSTLPEYRKLPDVSISSTSSFSNGMLLSMLSSPSEGSFGLAVSACLPESPSMDLALIGYDGPSLALLTGGLT